jgi:hypothetical protein
MTVSREQVDQLGRRMALVQAAAVWLAEHADDPAGAVARLRDKQVPATWTAALTRSAGIRLADVQLPERTADAAASPAASDADLQATFVKLAKQLGSYKIAAPEHPDVWAAAVLDADLNGGTK